ncbi:MAG: OmpA family protein [Treponema sp.]|jgi:outer membrane protein OmpA-like peptidoglycan-associated protein|nr:OmpA family protein [Treponema sp.]
MAMKYPITACLLFCAVLGWGQTAAEIEGLLETAEITGAQAAYFTLASVRETPPPSQAGAFALALELGWLPKNAEAHGKVRLDSLSLLLMRSFDLPGGVMYRLFHNARYAYQEMKALGLIQGRAYAANTVSGAEFLRILGELVSQRGAEPVKMAAVPAESPPAVQPEQAALAERKRIPEQAALAERKRIAEIIHTELAEKSIADTDVQATDEGITISLNNIRFLPDSTLLTEAEKQKLQSIAVILNEFPDRAILVGGHTAMAGSPEGRIKISMDRAQAVADYLVNLGCRSRDEMTVRGYGAERPLGDPDTLAGQALNRRVEITLLDEGRKGNE